jgi:hypothetical protein
VNGYLQMIAIGIDEAAYKDDIVSIERLDSVFEVVPPLADDITALIAQGDESELASGLLASQFLRFDEKSSADSLIGNEISDEDFFHKTTSSQ